MVFTGGDGYVNAEALNLINTAFIAMDKVASQDYADYDVDDKGVFIWHPQIAEEQGVPT